MSELLILDRFPFLKTLETQEEFEALAAAAKEDNHFGLIAPTHIVVRQSDAGQEVVGCASLGAVHCCHSWLHSQKVKPRETVMMMSLFDQVAKARGVELVVAPVQAGSPLYPCMEHWGWTKLPDMTLWRKKL
jgi:hypothetical protein